MREVCFPWPKIPSSLRKTGARFRRALAVLILQEPDGRPRRRRSKRGRHQKYSFSANCTARGSPGPPEPVHRIGESVLETWPNDPGEFRRALGFGRIGWVTAVKNSARNCKR